MSIENNRHGEKDTKIETIRDCTLLEDNKDILKWITALLQTWRKLQN